MKKTTNTELSAADQYRASMKGREEVIVDVHLPSGNIFKFAKLPGIFKMAFAFGKLPQAAASTAVDKWIEDGIIKPGEISEDQAAAVDEGIRIRNMILDHSRVPKLVVGEAGPGELSTDDLSDDDAAYLFQWAKAGGDTSLMLGSFPAGSQLSSADRNGGQKRGASAKRAA